MKKGQDPALIFKQISAINNQCNASSRTVAQDDLIAVVNDAAPRERQAVLNDAAPRERQAVLTNEQLRLGAALAIDHLEKAMNLHWRAIAKDNKNQDDDK
jgi:DNA-binding FrmR family transcriptional regulator